MALWFILIGFPDLLLRPCPFLVSTIDLRHIEVIDPEQAQMFRQMTVAERVAAIGQANRTARALVAAGLRHAHPDWDDQQIDAAVAERMARGTA